MKSKIKMLFIFLQVWWNYLLALIMVQKLLILVCLWFQWNNYTHPFLTFRDIIKPYDSLKNGTKTSIYWIFVTTIIGYAMLSDCHKQPYLTKCLEQNTQYKLTQSSKYSQIFSNLGCWSLFTGYIFSILLLF